MLLEDQIRSLVKKRDITSLKQFSESHPNKLKSNLYCQDNKGNTLLHYCAKRNSYEITKFLLNFEQENFKEKRQIYFNKLVILDDNEEYNYKPLTYISNSDGLLPSHLAAAFFGKFNNEENAEKSVLTLLIMSRLVDEKFKNPGSTVSRYAVLVDKDPIYDLTPLHCALIRRNENAAIAILKIITQEVNDSISNYVSEFQQNNAFNEIFLSTVDKNDLSAFHYCASYNCFKTIQEIVYLSKVNRNIRETLEAYWAEILNFSCLHIAAKEGHVNCYKILYDMIRGSQNEQVTSPEQNVLLQSDKNGNYPIHLAVLSGNKETVEQVLKDAKNSDLKSYVNKRKEWQGEHADSILDISSMTNNDHCCSKKMTPGASTPVLIAACLDKPDIIKLLIEDYNAHIKCCNYEGESIYHIAASENKVEVLEYLIGLDVGEEGFGCKNFLLHQNHDHQIPLMKACIEGHYKAGKILMKAHENEKAPGPYLMQDCQYRTCLHLIAEEANYEPSTKRYENYKKLVKLILKNCGNYDEHGSLTQKLIEAKDEDGNTALHNLCVKGTIDIAEILIQSAPNKNFINLRNDWDSTPIMTACKYDKKDMHNGPKRCRNQK